jgi:hypothetical protein
MSNFLESKKIRVILIVLASLIILLVVFGLGITIGYDRANFASHFDQNYYRNFYGNGVATGSYGMGPAPTDAHGITGTVIDLSSSTISVEDPGNDEHSIAVSSGTVIREVSNTIGINDIKLGDQIDVIGEPNDQGQIDARFIRVFSASSSIPMPQGQ